MVSYMESTSDYLLSEFELDRFDKTKVLTADLRKKLDRLYSSVSSADIDFIYDDHTGYSFEEYLETIVNEHVAEPWYVVVVLRHACVVWLDESEKMPAQKFYDKLVDDIFRRCEIREQGVDRFPNCASLRYPNMENKTRFQDMSNDDLISIVTSFRNEKMIKVILCCFEAVLSRDFSRFEDIEELIENYEKITEEVLSTEEIANLIDGNVELWIKILGEVDLDMQIGHSSYYSEDLQLSKNIKTGRLVYPELLAFKSKIFFLKDLNSKLRIGITVA